MSSVFIIHGVGGCPDENWFPWLKKELEIFGRQVFVPQFPTPENQALSAWIEVLRQYEEFLTPSTIFVGHSLGVPFILNVLEKYPAKATFLVSGFVGLAGNRFDDSMKTFSQRSFDWQKIKSNCKNFTVFHSDNDPHVRLQKAQELASFLDVEIQLVKNAGHFNSSAGYDRFDLLFQKMKPFVATV